MKTDRDQEEAGDLPFIRRTLIVIALVAGAFLIWELRYVFVLLFGSVLVATIIRSIAYPFKTYLRLPDGLAVAMSILLIVIALGEPSG